MNTLVLWILLTTTVSFSQNDSSVNAQWLPFATKSECEDAKKKFLASKKKRDLMEAECGELTYSKQ